MRRILLPVEQLESWAKLNGATFHNARAQEIQDHGAGLVAAHEIKSDVDSLIITVPRDLILSLRYIEDYARIDQHLKQVLTAIGDLAKTPRIAILIFLLLQITHRSPDLGVDVIGLANPFTDYVKFLPQTYTLPTLFTEEEQELLNGTTLFDALQQKLSSLQREYEKLQAATSDISWCYEHWWSPKTGKLSFEDWKLVDAMFRSRALDLPTTGHCMVPCVDMANHSSAFTVARYDNDAEGNAVLRATREVKVDEEITITYGNDKGASEMIFSYGFLEDNVASARQLFLDLDIPSDDPFRMAKRAVCVEAPGVCVYIDEDGKTNWDSRFVWWACVNEEDGLDFRLMNTNNGDRELKISWKDVEIQPADIQDTLSQDPLWSIFQLRATVMVQERIEKQATMLEKRYEAFVQQDEWPGARGEVSHTIKRLIILELELLVDAYQSLNTEKSVLLQSSTVQEYLSTSMCPQTPEDDFS